MSKELAKAVKELLDTIYDDAVSSYREGPQRIFNEKIWKRNDPELYRMWKNIKKILKRDGM